MTIPKDPFMLLSYINTQLRDNYSSLNEFLNQTSINEADIVNKLKDIEYFYDEKLNQFI